MVGLLLIIILLVAPGLVTKPAVVAVIFPTALIRGTLRRRSVAQAIPVQTGRVLTAGRFSLRRALVLRRLGPALGAKTVDRTHRTAALPGGFSLFAGCPRLPRLPVHRLIGPFLIGPGPEAVGRRHIGGQRRFLQFFHFRRAFFLLPGWRIAHGGRFRFRFFFGSRIGRGFYRGSGLFFAQGFRQTPHNTGLINTGA